MTAPSLLDELDGVVRLDGRIGTSERCVNFIRTHHAEIAAMAKRLEAAERDARVTTGPELFRFTSYPDWVAHAQDRFAAAKLGSWEYVCIDATGRICNMGMQFMSAQARNAYPVIVYHIDPERAAIGAAQEGEG